MENSETVAITSLTKGKLPSLPFVSMKNAILGRSYTLSIVVVPPTLSKKFNAQYRKKNKPTTILSFSLTKKNGELVLELKKIKDEAKLAKVSYRSHLSYLLIHGMLHLKGMAHGSKMETEEERWIHRYHISK